MRRSLSLRIVALVALLGVLGLISSGCTGVFTITFTWGRGGFFDDFVFWIGREDASWLGNEYYASLVAVNPLYGSDEELSRSEIIIRWQQYFDEYHIEVSSLGDVDQRHDDGHTAVVDVERYEVRRVGDSPYGRRERVAIEERYTLHKIGNEWRIIGVWERSRSVLIL